MIIGLYYLEYSDLNEKNKSANDVIMGVEEVQVEGNGNEKKKEIVVQIDFFSLDSNWTPLTLYRCRSNNFSHDQIFNLYYQNLVNRKCRWIKSLMRRSQSKVAFFKQ